MIRPLADRGIRLSPSQVYRLVVQRPERLSLKVFMALLDILNWHDGRPDRAGRGGRADEEDQGGRGRLRGRGRRAPPEAGADLARRAMTASANPVLDPVGVVASLVTAADPALDEETAVAAACAPLLAGVAPSDIATLGMPRPSLRDLLLGDCGC